MCLWAISIRAQLVFARRPMTGPCDAAGGPCLTCPRSSAGAAGLVLVAVGGCMGDWDKDPQEGHVNSGMKSKGEGEKVWRWWAWVTKVSEGVRRWRKWIKSASVRARGEMGCGTGRVTSCFCQFSFGGVDVTHCSDTRGQEHLSIWGGLSWGCGHESQFRQILTGVFTGWEIRLI